MLAARAPGLQDALERALAEEVPYLILDGKVVDTDRCREKTLSRKGKTIDLWYAGNTDDFGGNIQALFCSSGFRCGFLMCFRAMSMTWPPPARTSWACCGRSWKPCPSWPISGYEGAGHGVHVPVKKPAGVKELDIDTRARNVPLRSVRCLGERGFALLTQRWQTLQDVTASSPGAVRTDRQGRARRAIRAQDDHVRAQ